MAARPSFLADLRSARIAYRPFMMHRFLTSAFGLLAVVSMSPLSGCGRTDPPPFRLDMASAVSNEIDSPQRQAIADILQAMFGTPDEPHALPDFELDERLLRMAAGPVISTDLAAKQGLYRRHCAHCHGISGDGRGPTSIYLNPYPRDYRLGLFKFKSTYRDARPTDEDLRRVIENGIPSTAMPSFKLLPPDEVEALVEYVKYLSMRGQMELALERFVFDEDMQEPLDPVADASLRDTLGEFATTIAEGWKTASESVIVPEEASIPVDDRSPEELAESVAKGRELFYGTKANCFSCHGPTGLGDGQQTGFDDWTEPVRKFIEATDAIPQQIADAKKGLKDLSGEERQREEERIDELNRALSERQMVVQHLLPIRNAIPRNLREGLYRGGGRPIDIFWRISAGIAGTPMPAAGAATPGAQGTLTEEEIWQIVDYVHSLPFEPASRPPHLRGVELGSVTR
jgi:mono/diheme cytochrome c family protein